MESLKEKIGFIGAGNMAEAMIGAMKASGLVAPENILISDADPDRKDYIAGLYGIDTAKDNAHVFDQADMVILAVKPQQMEAVLEDLAKKAKLPPKKKKLVASIAAGFRMERMEKILYGKLTEDQEKLVPLVRVMPNTPALVCAGMAGIAGNRHATKEDLLLAERVMEASGEVCHFEENNMDAVTAVSGSGPAYVFFLAEIMTEAGVAAGLDENDAAVLALETIRGAATLMAKSEEKPAELRRRVTSPGGTTEAAFNKLKEKGVKDAFIQAILAAAQRGKELSGG